MDFEGELAVIISRRCYQLPAEENTADYVLGYTCLNDVTARDLQKLDVQFTRAKGFDTFCPSSLSSKPSSPPPASLSTLS